MGTIPNKMPRAVQRCKNSSDACEGAAAALKRTIGPKVRSHPLSRAFITSQTLLGFVVTLRT